LEQHEALKEDLKAENENLASIKNTLEKEIALKSE
jgi:hypothetical protein